MAIGVFFWIALFAFFYLKPHQENFEGARAIGFALLSLLFLFIGGVYLREHHPDFVSSNRKLSLFIVIVLLSLLLAKFTEYFLYPFEGKSLWRYPLFLPFTAILSCSLLNRRIAIFAVVFVAIAAAIGLSVPPLSFIVINILVGAAAVLFAPSVRRRKDVFIIAARALITAFFALLAFDLLAPSFSPLLFLKDVGNAIIYLVLMAILAIGLLPLFETTFGIMTDITLMEFMDPNQELLRRLTLEAPGTHQHSMIVGTLSEAAANAIGSNGLFCRVASLYHDVGKLTNPQYFTENQIDGVDMHQLLTPLESAQVIIAHVSEGVAMARKAGLPEPFIDIIKEHHGTTLVYYFYHKQLEIEGGNKELVKESDFRYGGPTPRSKESTLIMIADTLEAASRSLDVFNEESISELVHALIAQKTADGQFDRSLLTLEEITIAKEAMIKALFVASHPRVKYPPHHTGEEG